MLTTNLHIHHHYLIPPTRPFKILNPARTAAATTKTATTDAGLLFREKLHYLEFLNVNTHKALTQNPNLRSTPLFAVHAVVKCLSAMGLQHTSIGRILDMHPSLLTSDPYLNLYPIFDFLMNEVQIPYPDISKSINRCPRLLVSSVPEQLRPAHIFLQSLGFVGPKAIDSQASLLLVYNVESTMMSKIDYLMSLGFEYDVVKNMVVRSPGILTFSVENNLVPKAKFFLEEMNGDLQELKTFPQYFSFSLERKIKPRHRMLVEHRMKLPLSRMLKVSDGEFSTRLVEMQLRMVGEG